MDSSRVPLVHIALWSLALWSLAFRAGSVEHLPSTMTTEEFESIAAFRYAFRNLLLLSEQAARKAGIPPQQPQLLLAIKGYPGA